MKVDQGVCGQREPYPHTKVLNSFLSTFHMCENKAPVAINGVWTHGLIKLTWVLVVRTCSKSYFPEARPDMFQSANVNHLKSNSFLPSVLRDWNTLPAEAKQLNIVSSFKYF